LAVVRFQGALGVVRGTRVPPFVVSFYDSFTIAFSGRFTVGWNLGSARLGGSGVAWRSTTAAHCLLHAEKRVGDGNGTALVTHTSGRESDCVASKRDPISILLVDLEYLDGCKPNREVSSIEQAALGSAF
jgi:hypothetical protein